jgi:hypothetical protein
MERDRRSKFVSISEIKENIEEFNKSVRSCWFQWITGQDAVESIRNLIHARKDIFVLTSIKK